MKIAVITGASDGIGKASAKKLSDDGFFVCLLARSEDKLKQARKEIKNSDYFVCDITDAKKVEQTIKEIAKKYKRIDVLVNDAGIWIEGELDSNEPDDIRKAIETNSIAQLYVTKEVIPIMKKQKSGIIINIVSQAGLMGKAERVVYNASKYAMTGATHSLQLELRKYGIKVAGIYPAKVNTTMFIKAGIKKSVDNALQPEDVANSVIYIVSQPKDIEISDIILRLSLIHI